MMRELTFSEYETAVKWYILAEQGDAVAQTNLGLMYSSGDGIAHDNQTALKWFTLAAKQGNTRAQTCLGFMYSLGLGVESDNVHALMWLDIAASSGSEHAIKGRDSIVQKMTASQRKKAQALARDFAPSVGQSPGLVP